MTRRGENRLEGVKGRQRRFLAVFWPVRSDFGKPTGHRIAQDRRSRPPEGVRVGWKSAWGGRYLSLLQPVYTPRTRRSARLGRVASSGQNC